MTLKNPLHILLVVSRVVFELYPPGKMNIDLPNVAGASVKVPNVTVRHKTASDGQWTVLS